MLLKVRRAGLRRRNHSCLPATYTLPLPRSAALVGNGLWSHADMTSGGVADRGGRLSGWPLDLTLPATLPPSPVHLILVVAVFPFAYRHDLC